MTGQETDDGDGSGRDSVTRRETLRLGGAAVATGVGLGTAGTVSAAGGYDEVTVAAGETWSRDLRDGDTLENLLIDASAPDATVDIHVVGSGWTVRNVGILGPGEFDRAGKAAIIRGWVDDPDGTGTVENVYVRRSHDNFLFMNHRHAGHIDVRNSTFVGADNDGQEDTLYGSPPGHPDIDWDGYKNPGAGGTIRVEGCHTENVADYGWRLASDGSELVDSTVVNAEVGVANLYGRPVTLRNVDIVDCDIGIRMGSHLTDFDFHDRLEEPVVTELQDVRISGASRTPIQRNAHSGDEPVERDLDGDGRPVLDEPADPTPPATAPTSARQAARGDPTLDRTITVESTDGRTDYRIEVSGGIALDGRGEGSDGVSGDVATGAVWEGYSDRYRFAGSVERVEVLDGDRSDLRVTVDGEPYLDRTLRVESAGREAQVDYRAEVTGAATPGDRANPGDTADGTTITGTVSGWTDTFRFAGDLTSFTVTDGPASDVRVFVDGEERPFRRLSIASETSLEYRLGVSGRIEPGPAADAGDTTDGGVARGALGGWRDSYRFSGSLADIDVSGGSLADLEVAVDGASAFDRRLTFESVGDREWVSYLAEVTGEVRPAERVDEGDDSDDAGTVEGGVGDGGRDVYEFFGEVNLVSVLRGDRSDLAVLVDGEPRERTIAGTTDGDGETMAGSLSAGEVARHQVPVEGDPDRVRITLTADADHDLYVTLDGRRPYPAADRRRRSAGGTEEVVVDGDPGAVGVAVHAVDAGRYTLSVTTETHEDGGESDDGLPHGLVVTGGDGVLGTYGVTVSGSIRRDDAASETASVLGGIDRVDGATASGTVDGGRDVYRFSGAVTERSVRGDATIEVRREE